MTKHFNIDKNCEKTFDEHSDSLRVFYFVNLEILKINGIHRSGIMGEDAQIRSGFGWNAFRYQLTGCDQFTDWIAFGGEFLFVFGHDVAFIHLWIMMQISCGGI